MEELDIPNNWVASSMVKIFDFGPRNNDVQDNTECSFVPMPCLDEKSGEILSYEIKKWAEVKRGYTHFRTGDVIFAKITPCMENKKCAVARELKNDIAAGSTEFHVLRAPFGVVPDFLWLYLRQSSFVNLAEKNMTGSAGQKRVPAGWLKEQLFPLPPTKEQIRIVKKIKECFQNIDNIEIQIKSAKAAAENFWRSTLSVTFLPNEHTEYPLAKLSDLGVWRGGGTPAKSNPLFWTDGSFSWVSPKDMGTDFIEETIDKITESAIENSSANLIDQDSILIVTRSGILRRTVPIAMNLIPVTLNQDLKAITPDKSLVSTKFLFYCLKAYEKEILQNCTKVGATVESIDFNKLKALQVPLPPLNVQKETVEKIEKIRKATMDLLEHIDQKHRSIESLRQSILRKAFRGELVPQDLDDGTGKELFDKIQADKELQDTTARKTKKKKSKKKVARKKVNRR